MDVTLHASQDLERMRKEDKTEREIKRKERGRDGKGND